MYNDAVDLWEFYGSSLGKVARRLIRQRIRHIWPHARGMSLVGLGYVTPYLSIYSEETARTIAMMPAQQGVLRWPPEGSNIVTLVDERDLPLEDASVERVILVHALECTEQTGTLLNEVWRILSGDGRLLVVVPNRRGLWARLDRTPFGHGHPYSPSQLSRALRTNGFVPTFTARALYVPPYPSPVMLRSAMRIERLGSRWFTQLGGVIIMEASKQIYAVNRPRSSRVGVPVMVPVLAR